jgi:hypothetical protein
MPSPYYAKFKFSGIYSIINLKNEKRYVGSAKNIYKRWLQHSWDLRKGNHHCEHLQRSFDKYGEKNFVIEVLEIFDNSEWDSFDSFINIRERFWIDEYKTRNPDFGYNLTDGGLGCPGRKVSKETREKMSNSLMGRIVSDEWRRRISEAGIGRKHTEETKRKMSESRIGKPQPWNLGRIPSQETRDKLSAANLGKHGNPETGKKITKTKTGLKIIKDSSSGYVGVSLDKRNKKWKAYISVNKKKIHLGYFLMEIDAAIAYNNAALFYFKEAAKLNII